MPQFPAGFAWGAATAAYQIEGAVAEDGRWESVWDTFCRRPGAIRDGHTGDVAADHYHRWPGDIELMTRLGITAYRFSIAWPRVQPPGHGPANDRGLDFYDRLTDALLAAGITPVPTLFHWDLPQPLEDLGGWLARDTAYRFADYTALAARRLADRIPLWITLNEPFVVTTLGYGLGIHAPGQALGLGALPTAHHQLLGHGLATAALRSAGARQVAITNNYAPAWPASDSPADVTAARAYDSLHNRLFTDPVLLGAYPDLSAFGIVDAPGYVRDGDLALISAPLDALGVNYYSPARLSALPDSPLPFHREPIPGYPVTAFGWPVVPAGLRELLLLLRERYGQALPPVYITENGCSTDDVVAADGTIDDQPRIRYLDEHLRALHEAITAGVDVRGYLTWSLIDNFEWAEGYNQRFGLVHIDFSTQQRTPKSSFGWYRALIAAQRSGPPAAQRT
ncbi:MAG: GH1 family beta-glucosidase [Streptosporangiaceae bacterium]|jgi:beta-glucosidase